jgi:hypothetical protein
MSGRWFIAILFAVTCTAAVWGVVAQGKQLSGLRAEHKRLEAADPATNSAATEVATAPSTTPEVPRELLQLRAEVARLSHQQRELASARPENEKLRLQLENRRTNSAAIKAGGGRYIKMSEVKWRGYNTPEEALHSAFWAIQNRDLAKYLESIRPDVAKEMADGLRNESRLTEDFFKNMHLPPVFKIAGREQNEEDTIVLQVEIAPDIPPEAIFLRKVGGQWKLESPLR